MTICISVRIPEGLVLAADSAASLEGTINTPQGPQTGILQTFNYASKVAQIKDYPIGVMSWGIASLGNRSIQGLIMEFEYDYPKMEANKDYTVKKIADDLLKFLREKYIATYPANNKQPRLGIFIGGYSHYSKGNFFSEQFIFDFPKSTDWKVVRPNQPDGGQSFGADWFGQIDMLTRLILGYDRRGLDELIKRGVDKTIVQKWTDDHISQLPLAFDGMPLQDAVDFAHYAVQLTIGAFRFALGPPLCGGDVDIAVITPAAFHWAKRKQWSIKE